jgi:NADH:ubiquinone oxidoreductase subunit 4 (subunit M)
MNRLLFGPLKYNTGFFPVDITIREFFVLIPLVFLIIFFGLFPTIFFEKFEFGFLTLFEHLL